MTTKERAELRALAAAEPPVVYVGKNGITDALIESCREVLEKRELIKGKVQESCELTPREVCGALCEELQAEPVQVIGTKFVIYKKKKE